MTETTVLDRPRLDRRTNGLPKRVVALLVIAAVALAAGTVLFALNRATGRADTIYSVHVSLEELGPALAFFLVGVVLMWRRPGNLVGTLCGVFGLLAVLAWALTEYAGYGLLSHPGSLPGAFAALLLTEEAFGLYIILPVLIASVFPEGRLLSRRWRLVPAAALLGYAAMWVAGLTAEPYAPFGYVHNPWDGAHPQLAGIVSATAIALLIASVIGAVASVTVRFRRSRGDERAQLKWLVFAASLLPITIIGHLIAQLWAPGAVGAVEVLFSLAVLCFPVAIGIAVLKYRLYEINVIVRRTLIYGAVTALLAGSYAAVVVLLQAVLGSVTQGNGLAVAGSTLVVAALFRPVVRRVQAGVDRRFYRSKVDTEAMLARFGARVRDEADLHTLVAELDHAVRDAMQPALVGVWLRNDLGTPTSYKGGT